MKLPKPTRRDCVASLVGAAVAALLLLLAGQRWQVVPAPTETAPVAYQVDGWTGRAWLLAGDRRDEIHDADNATPTASTIRAAVAFAVVAGALVGGVVLLSRRNS